MAEVLRKREKVREELAAVVEAKREATALCCQKDHQNEAIKDDYEGRLRQQVRPVVYILCLL